MSLAQSPSVFDVDVDEIRRDSHFSIGKKATIIEDLDKSLLQEVSSKRSSKIAGSTSQPELGADTVRSLPSSPRSDLSAMKAGGFDVADLLTPV